MRLLSIISAVTSIALLFSPALAQFHDAEDAYNTERDIDFSAFAKSIQGAMEQRGTWDLMKRDTSFEALDMRGPLTLEELVARTQQAGLVEREPNTLMPASQALPLLVALDPTTGAEYKSYDAEGGDAGPPSPSAESGPYTTNFALSSLPSTIIPPYYSPGGKGGAITEDDTTSTSSGAATRGARVPLGFASGLGAGAAAVVGVVGGMFLAMA